MEQIDQTGRTTNWSPYPTTATRGKYQFPDDDKPQNDRIFWHHPTAVKDDRNSVEKTSDDEEEKLKPSDFLFFAANSTFHGMSHIFTPGRYTLRKALWGFAFVFSLSLFLYQAYDRYNYYGQRPHVTKLDEKEVEEMVFPAVTICNMNPFRVKEITQEDYFYAGEHILEMFDSEYNLRGKMKDNKMWPLIQPKIKQILEQRNDFQPKTSSFNVFEFYDRTGHEFRGIIKQCKYRGKDCIPLWNTVFTRYGKCYTFNAMEDEDKWMKTLKGGVDNGLEVLLDTEQDDYMPVWAESDEISVEAGFKVQLHAQREPPFIHELGFGISPGFQRLVATQKQRITFLPYPYGDCELGANKSTHLPYKNYSISACRIICETKYVLSKCKCRMVHMPGDAPYCPPEIYKKCADKELDMLVQTDEKICVCKTPCDVIRYNLEMSSLRLPSTQALSYLAFKYNKTEEYVKRNFAKLNIFFEALNYETIDQKKAYELPGLLGDIGGQMGLFIGASILTVLELFDYIYEVIKEKLWGKKKAKKRKASERKGEQNGASNARERIQLSPKNFECDSRVNTNDPNPEYSFYTESIRREDPAEEGNVGIDKYERMQQDSSYHNAGFSNNQELTPSTARVLRRPVSCNIYPYGVVTTSGAVGEHDGMESWLSPRPHFKEFPKLKQKISTDAPFPTQSNHDKKHELLSPLNFAQNTAIGSFSPFETDIH